MALSGMSSREKTIVAVLAVVIVLALVGIGIVAAQLINGDSEDDTAPIAVASASASPQPGDTDTEITPVPPPELEEPKDEPPPSEATQPVAVARAESPGPLAPAMIASQTLYAGHRYRIEIRAADGSQLAVTGSWSQAATSSGQQVAPPQIEFFEGTTPHNITVNSPVANPEMWACSVSASFKEGLGTSTSLMITIWDVTGAE